MAQQHGLKFDDGKVRLDLVPDELVWQVALTLTYGEFKYGAANTWQDVENGPERYMAACLRHIYKFRLGEIIDPESGLHHLAHAAANLSFMLHLCRQDLTQIEDPGVREKWEEQKRLADERQRTTGAAEAQRRAKELPQELVDSLDQIFVNGEWWVRKDEQ